MCLLLVFRIGNIRKSLLQTMTEVAFGNLNWLGRRGGQEQVETSVLYIVCMRVQSLSAVWLIAAPWTVACQAPLSMEFSRQVYWSELPFPTRGDLPDSGIKPKFLVSPALAVRIFTTSATWEAHVCCIFVVQLLSRVWLFATLWTAACQASLSFILELAQTHVHQVGDAIQPSHPLSSPSPAFDLSQHQGLFQWAGSSRLPNCLWTWVWVNSGSWQWTGMPGVLQSMGLQSVRPNWATELKWIVSDAQAHPLTLDFNQGS